MADKKRSGLGSGLAAILGHDFQDFDDLTRQEIESGESVSNEIPVDKIYPNPYQPRKVFDEAELEELASSIQQHGIFQPILVKPTDTGYILLAGERRVRAAKMVGLETIPAIVKDFSESELIELSLLENIQREDLSVIEEALSYQQLMDKLHYTQEEVAKRVGKSRAHVANILRLLNLPKEIQEMVNHKELTMGQVRPLVTLSESNEQIRLAKMIKNMDLSSRQAEMLAKRSSGSTPKKRVIKEVDPEIKKVERRLTSKFMTKVVVGEHEIKIAYKDVSDLNRILEIMDELDES